jgi:hypothetical protein
VRVTQLAQREVVHLGDILRYSALGARSRRPFYGGAVDVEIDQDRRGPSSSTPWEFSRYTQPQAPAPRVLPPASPSGPQGPRGPRA